MRELPKDVLIVHTPKLWEYRATQQVLFDLGGKWSDGQHINLEGHATYGEKTCIYFELDHKRLTYGNTNWSKDTFPDEPVFDFEGLIGIMRQGSIQRTIRLGEYRVTNINHQGFQVGCTEITWRQAEEVMKLRPKEEED